MRIIDRYIAKTIISGTFMVLLVLGALLAFVDFVSEMDDVGKGTYSIFEASLFVLLSSSLIFFSWFTISVWVSPSESTNS